MTVLAGAPLSAANATGSSTRFAPAGLWLVSLLLLGGDPS
jgi:hypothetical protein